MRLSPAVFPVLLWACTDPPEKPLPADVCPTPLADQLFTDTTGQVAQRAAQEHELTEDERGFAAVLWALVITSHMESAPDPWILDPGTQSTFVDLARQYPSFYTVCSAAESEASPLTEVSCVEPCKAKLSDFPESEKTFASEAAGVLGVDDYWTALEAAGELKKFVGHKGGVGGDQKTLMQKIKEGIRDKLFPKDKANFLLGLIARGAFLGAAFASGGLSVALTGVGAAFKAIKFTRKLRKEFKEANARIEECRAAQIANCGAVVPGSKGGGFWRCEDEKIVPASQFCDGKLGDCKGGDDEGKQTCEFWCGTLHPELYRCSAEVCKAAIACNNVPDCPGGEDEAAERCADAGPSETGDAGPPEEPDSGPASPQTCRVSCCCLGYCVTPSFPVPAGKTCADCVALANPNCSCGPCCTLTSCN